jgi:DNA replication protein DnaC
LTTLERIRLLIIGDWGPEPLDSQQRRDLLEIVDDRYDKGSLLITSQVPVSGWHEVIGNPPWATPSSTASSTAPIGLDLRGEFLRRRLAATAVTNSLN